MIDDQIILFSTDGCHLCELAAAQLNELGIVYITTDIIDSPALVKRYGITIPVVKRDNGCELNWPFELEQLAHFLELEQ